MIIEIEHKKKAYVSPTIEVVTCDAGELMGLSALGPDQSGNLGETAKQSNSLFTFYDEDEDDFFAVETDVDEEEPDAIDEIINRLR